MARRIGLAQAMINDPSFLILDEPTSGLDPIGCKEVKDLILMLKKRGKTVLVTSHLLSDVEDICDRVIILYGGKIRATGTLNELLTVKNENRIVTPELSPAATEKILKILRTELKDESFTFDHPRRSLEDFFLNVIEQAKAADVETAGVVSGGKIADYLSAHDEDETGAMIQELVAEAKPLEVPKPQAVPAQTAAEAAIAEERKLEELTSEVKAAVPDPALAKSEEEARELEAADEKLQNLL